MTSLAFNHAERQKITIGNWTWGVGSGLKLAEGPARSSWDTSFHLLIDVATFLLAISGATFRNVMAWETVRSELQRRTVAKHLYPTAYYLESVPVRQDPQPWMRKKPRRVWTVWALMIHQHNLPIDPKATYLQTWFARILYSYWRSGVWDLWARRLKVWVQAW